MRPCDVKISNSRIARQNLERRYRLKNPCIPIYSVRDLIRVSRARTVFVKAYEGNGTLEIFKIIRIDTTSQPPVYILEDLSGEKIDGSFYEEQLNRVRKDLEKDTFEIEKILQSKGTGKKKQYLVSWKGYPEKFAGWISATDLKELK